MDDEEQRIRRKSGECGENVGRSRSEGKRVEYSALTIMSSMLLHNKLQKHQERLGKK